MHPSLYHILHCLPLCERHLHLINQQLNLFHSAPANWSLILFSCLVAVMSHIIVVILYVLQTPESLHRS